MRPARATAWACAAFTLAGAAAAQAQGPPLTLDPSVAGQGTALVLGADESMLSRDGRPADSITLALARGIRVDTAAREQLCDRAQAARAACPESSRIGSGRYAVAVRGWLLGTGEAQLAWSMNAFLGKPLVRGDAASVVLTGALLGAGNVAAFLAPALGAAIPNTASVTGRLVPRRSGAYGLELRFAELPVQFDLPAPITVTPARLELALSAVRRVREDFFRRFRIRTPSGYEVRKIRDHRLVGHHLLRTPRTCKDTWPSEVRALIAGAEKRTRGRIPCSEPGA